MPRQPQPSAMAGVLMVVMVGLHGMAGAPLQGDQSGQERTVIVTFRAYAEAVVREQLLRSILDMHNVPREAWRVLSRRNAASAYPSDFDVLAPGPTDDFAQAVQVLQLALRLDPRIVSVTEQQRWQRPLQSLQSLAATAGGQAMQWDVPWSGNTRQLLRAVPESGQGIRAAEALHVSSLWKQGFAGQGVRVGIFDTGLSKRHSHFRHVAERTDWTDEGTLEDGLGHGSFVAGQVASQNPECPGLAPEAQLHIFRVFTNQQVSFTSWFLDAFNYAIHTRIEVINLSIGGPDFRDAPFAAKVNELTANNVIMVSAIGNDGPVFGTLNNPADQNNVIGVGGATLHNTVALFSSRGMTNWELPGGYGRFKPDIVTYGVSLLGSRMDYGCRALSGTSVASPVVAGAVVLLASVVPSAQRRRLVNPASMKQALLSTARRLPGASIFEQGHGHMNISAAAAFLQSLQPHASVVPAQLDTTDCPFMDTFCDMDLYAGGMPLIANLTLLNGMGVIGYVIGRPQWRPNLDRHGGLIEVALDVAPVLWPWTGHLGVTIAATPAARYFQGTAEGVVVLTVQSPGENLSSRIVLPIKVAIIPTPMRQYRLLWDQFHSLAYPSGFFPRDNLNIKTDPLDWNGDHPHSNFRTAFRFMRSLGYHVEILGAPFTCFDARLYGALLVVDPEEEYFAEEVKKLQVDVNELGLSLIVIADWYSLQVMAHIKFFDENTRNWWFPETGGSNVPAINDLLAQWGITLGGNVYNGRLAFRGQTAEYLSGTSIETFPANGSLLSTPLLNQGKQLLHNTELTERVPILGFYQTPAPGGGRIVVYGDSSGLDDAHSKGQERCTWLLRAMLEYATLDDLGYFASIIQPLVEGFSRSAESGRPARSPASTLHLYSSVVNRPLPFCPSQRFLGHTDALRDGPEYDSLLASAGEPKAASASHLRPFGHAPYTLPSEGSGWSEWWFRRLVFTAAVLMALAFALLLWSRLRSRQMRLGNSPFTI